MLTDSVTWVEISKALHRLVNLQTIWQRRALFSELVVKYPSEVALVVSISSLTSSFIRITPIKYNNFSHIDLKKDLGVVLFHYLEGNKQGLRDHLKETSYNFSILLNIMFSQTLFTRVGESTVLEELPKLFSMAEVLAEVDLPDVLTGSEFSTQGLTRNKFEQTELPFTFIQIPKKIVGSTRLCYFLKDGSKITSNTNSQVVKDTINKAFDFTKYGLIFLETRMDGYKLKRKIIPILFSHNQKAIKELYVGKGADLSEFTHDFRGLVKEYTTNKISLPPKATTVTTKEELLKFVLASKRKKNFLVINNQGLTYFSLKKEYSNYKIADYILDEDYEAKGVTVDIDGKLVPIYFNLPDELIDYGITDRYIRVEKLLFKDFVVAHSYNSLKEVWHPKHSSCSLCGHVDTQHKSGGLCATCYGKLSKISLYSVNTYFMITRKVVDNFNLQIHDYVVKGNSKAGVVEFDRDTTQSSGLQKPLPHGSVEDGEWSLKYV